MRPAGSKVSCTPAGALVRLPDLRRRRQGLEQALAAQTVDDVAERGSWASSVAHAEAVDARAASAAAASAAAAAGAPGVW